MINEILTALAVSVFTGSVAPEDRECLALNVYFESRDQSYKGQMAVAEVTMNRVMHEKFPDSVCGVVYQPGAFSWTYDSKDLVDGDIPFIDNVIDERAWEIANNISIIYTEGVRTNFTKDALYYHTYDISPYWSNHFEQTVKIGDHIFYSKSLHF